jgi:class 3 adenylate cyclase
MMGVLRRSKSFSIRQRVALSLISINILFACNVAFFAWSNHRRKSMVQDLRRAIGSEKAIGSVAQQLNNIQRQVTLLSQAAVESGEGAGEHEIAEFKMQLDKAGVSIHELADKTRGESQRRARELVQAYKDLRVSWLIFFENFGVRHATAIMELAVRAEPLSQRMLRQLVPALQDAEGRAVESASSNFDSVAQLTDRISFLMFVLSGLIALVIGYRLSQSLTAALGELKRGTILIGSGRLDHRIEVPPGDEFGELATAFNEMSARLRLAQAELTTAHEELESRHNQVERQRQISDSLLLNILPEPIAGELRDNGVVAPKYFEDVTILFADFVGFTLSTEKLAAENLVESLHEYFTVFDRITARYNVEKLKTIGDSYMCVSGMPARSPSHPVDMVLAAFEIVHAVQELGRRPGSPRWSVRIGIHSGPVIAGVVGIKKFAFDIWGESVNYGSRMESSGAANRINLSERTHSRVKDFFACEHRGKITTKEKREMDMYFANGVLPELAGQDGSCPPPEFVRRYGVYFQKAPPAFPAFLLARAAHAAAGEIRPDSGRPAMPVNAR